MDLTLDAAQVPPFGEGLVDELAWDHLVGWWVGTGHELGAGEGFNDYWEDVRDAFGALENRSTWLNLLAIKTVRAMLASGQLRLAGGLPPLAQVVDLVLLVRAGLMEAAATALTNLPDIRSDDRLTGQTFPLTLTVPPAS